jgi:hypothetical protein
MAFVQPGKSYEDVWDLIYRNLPANSPFSLELIMAICWEESLFNNIEQIGGTAWGFGQVEPAEYYKFRTPDAAYPVQGLPPVRNFEVEVKNKKGETVTIKKARLAGTLTDQQSVQVVIAALMHGYRALGSAQASMRAYAGVGYSGSDVPSRLSDAGKRLAIIDGWLACEAHLQRKFDPPPPKFNKKGERNYIDFSKSPNYSSDFPTFIKDGLAKAKAFDTKSVAIDDILFPKNYVTEDNRRIWWPNPTVGYAYHMIAGTIRP